MSPWISEGSLMEQGVRTNSSLRLKTGIQELQHKAWSGLLHPSSILFSYHGAHQEADPQLCYVGACLPVWLLGKETKKQKLKKKKSFESFGKKKKFWKQNSQQTGAVILQKVQVPCLTQLIHESWCGLLYPTSSCSSLHDIHVPVWTISSVRR